MREHNITVEKRLTSGFLEDLEPYSPISSRDKILQGNMTCDLPPLKLDWNESTLPPSVAVKNAIVDAMANNQNLLNYMILKYNVKNSGELKQLAELYEKEKDDRARLRGSEKTLMESQRELLQMLRNFHLQFPDVWMNQLSGLVNDKEEVEVRHHLNQQRQSLRERMDYNEKRVMGRAREEIERLARDYPEYADEILDMVARRRVK